MINDIINNIDTIHSNDLCKYNKETLIPMYFKHKDIWEDMILPPSIGLLFGFLEAFFNDLKIGDSLLV